MPRTKIVIPDGLVPKLLAEWQGGMRQPALARMASEACGRTIGGSTVRQWMIKELGGMEAWEEARMAREAAHPRARPTPPKRTPRDPAAPPVDVDADVPRIIHSREEFAGRWQVLHERPTPMDIAWSDHYEVFVDPDGQRFQRCDPRRRADLLIDMTAQSLGVIRLARAA